MEKTLSKKDVYDEITRRVREHYKIDSEAGGVEIKNGNVYFGYDLAYYLGRFGSKGTDTFNINGKTNLDYDVSIKRRVTLSTSLSRTDEYVQKIIKKIEEVLKELKEIIESRMKRVNRIENEKAELLKKYKPKEVDEEYLRQRNGTYRKTGCYVLRYDDKDVTVDGVLGEWFVKKVNYWYASKLKVDDFLKM